ncbi:MAG: UPF0147 family protein [Thaumarchaeota archaeon]|nr:UPF0147 family protein [Candidatus Calditenuaceae archaeon]MDW8186478.1 UPF0147 family protein [Nitrososphaerota archaeon]
MEIGGWTWDEKRKRIAQILETIANDNTAPRNLRKAVKGAMDELFNERYSPSVRAANAIEMIEEVLSDGNIPSYTRTQLWLAISLLETVKAGQY